MAFDIYGNRLERGHCEVHPHVHQEYPCSICMSEKRQSHAAHPSPDCGICGGPHGCADSNGYVVCSQECSYRAEMLPPPIRLISEYEAQRAAHAALIAKVREIAEDIPHEESCSLHAMSKALRSALGLTANKCTCPRGKLLALCEVK